MIKFTHNDYEILERKVTYQGIFRIAHYQIRNRLFQGGFSETYLREVMERGVAAAVLLYDPTLDKVVLIEQFRIGAIAHPISPWQIEIVAGMLDKGENPEEVAKREAIEESGCDILELYPIYDYFVSPGASTEYIHVFCGKVDASRAEGIHGLAHEHEDIRVLTLSSEEAFLKVRTGEIKNATAIIALQWLELNKENLRKYWGA